METIVKFGMPEPIIYKDPETLVSVSARVLGTVEVYTQGATEGQARDVIETNVRQAVILGLVKFFDDMSKNSVPFSKTQIHIKDAQKAITASVKNAGYGVGTVIIHSINCDSASQEALNNARLQIFKEETPPQPSIVRMATSATVSAAPYSTVVVGPAATAGPKFCPNCGTPTNGAKFCTNCGNKLI